MQTVASNKQMHDRVLQIFLECDVYESIDFSALLPDNLLV
jgi:hypothetical protein